MPEFPAKGQSDMRAHEPTAKHRTLGRQVLTSCNITMMRHLSMSCSPFLPAPTVGD